MIDVIIDSLLDTLKVLPFLFCVYLLIELLEDNDKAMHKTVKLLNGKFAPVIAGGVGLVPQCGFSVLTADLFSQNFIKTGTLVAVLVATSDEALPILFTNPDTLVDAFVLLAFKVVYAVILGYLVNLFDKRSLSSEEFHRHEQGCCHHEGSEKHGFGQFVKHPLIHTAKIFAYLVIVNVVFGTLLFYFEDNVTEFAVSTVYLQPFLVALVGLIPNCGSSVIIASLYQKSIISFGAMTAGLVCNCGIAFAVLFRNGKAKQNLIILAIMYLSGCVLGLMLTLFGVAF